MTRGAIRSRVLALLGTLLAAAASGAGAQSAVAGAAASSLSEPTWNEDGSAVVGLADGGKRTAALQAYDGATGRPTWRIPLDALRDPASGPALQLDRWRPSAVEGEVLLEAKGDLFLAKARPSPGSPPASTPASTPASFPILRRLTTTASAEAGATLSPDGYWVAYARDGDLWAIELAHGRERRLTDDGRPPAVLNGGDGSGDGIFSGGRSFAWAPESRTIAFERRSGGVTTLHLVSTIIPGVLELETGVPSAGSIARALWRFDARAVVVERRNTGGGKIELLLCHPEKLYCRPLAHRAPRDGELSSGFPWFLANGFVWDSAASASGGLALYDTLGRERSLLRSGDWQVTRLEAVDESTDAVLARATRSGEGGKNEEALLRIDPGFTSAPLVIASGTDLDVAVSPAGTAAVVTLDDGARRDLRGSDGKKIADLPPPPRR